MAQPGTIVQYSCSDTFGLIHAGGTDHAAFLGFNFVECSDPVKSRLNQGNIPPNDSIAVAFDTAVVNGHVVAVSVH